ncbi:DUF3558 domain-containing protein [Rhodococcus pyridinivorans]|uniref:DUF3558 domain-containing protein n=1 Tax=Rhodococcus pyridinivorans TaxID=103816 RepID=A0A7M2XQL5_9NOCA|nr:DUF3558 domain-containing protein [Rhodococcus pyridinivorans]QOW00129.1 DUF3558 domain-containing protein [Rhodococcus pyridinivorans]WMM74028.1 DUF3558 domain-containing protein [Rhodococcus pyridinivorans]
MGRWGIVALAALAVMGTACSPGSADDAAVGDETATTTTRTPRITDDSGRPPVTFDPCYDIPDDVMNAAGYDAAKKEIADMPMGTHTFLGCTYDNRDHIPGVRRGYGLNILSGNVTFEEERAKNGHMATETSIGGRRALLEINPADRNTCAYVLQTDFGLVIVSRLYYADHAGPAPQSEWCAGLIELVTKIESFIDK